MGFGSGLWGGENGNRAPAARSDAAASGLLWLDRLSRTTTSPSRKIGASWVSVQRANISPLIAPSMTQGASRRSWRKAATKVRVRQRPNGARSVGGRPHGARPGGPGDAGLDRGLGDKDQPFQMVGHEGLALRDPDAALHGDIPALPLKRLNVFFVRRPEPPQHPPDGPAVHVNAMGFGQFHDQRVERDLALCGDARPDPAGHAGRLAVAAAVAVRKRRQRSGCAPQLDQIVHELRRHPDVARRRAMPAPFIDKGHHALA